MAGVHVANGRLRTSNKGVIRQVFKFAVDSLGDPTAIKQAAANFVLSVSHPATGRYVVQLNKLYPVREIFVNAILAPTSLTDTTKWCRYKGGSYNASAGTFEIHVSKPTDDTHATTQVAVDPANGSEVHVEIVYVDQTTGIVD